MQIYFLFIFIFIVCAWRACALSMHFMQNAIFYFDTLSNGIRPFLTGRVFFIFFPRTGTKATSTIPVVLESPSSIWFNARRTGYGFGNVSKSAPITNSSMRWRWNGRLDFISIRSYRLSNNTGGWCTATWYRQRFGTNTWLGWRTYTNMHTKNPLCAVFLYFFSSSPFILTAVISNTNIRK